MTANYTMEQLNAFLYDALNEENLSAQQIYETIIETVAEHTEYLQIQYEKSQQLFDLLKGTAKPYKSPWDTYLQDNNDENDCMPPWGHSDLEYASKHSEENKVKTWILPVDDEGGSVTIEIIPGPRGLGLVAGGKVKQLSSMEREREW